MYLNTDAIAARDLGFARAKKEITPTNTVESVNGASGSGSSQNASLKRRNIEEGPSTGGGGGGGGFMENDVSFWAASFAADLRRCL